MTWNYRVIKRNDGKNDYYAIHEVYYRPDETSAWTATSIKPYGKSIEELGNDLIHMQEALRQPVLQEVMKDGEEVLEEIN
jgi:hypothetical protein